MASHFSSIGLRLVEKEEFSNYFDLAYQNGEKIKTNSGTYVKWVIGCGVELWGQIDINNTAIGMNPHFMGPSRMKIRIEKIINRENDTNLDGSFYCWAGPTEVNEGGTHPFVFDVPDIATYGDISLPQIVTAQLTGFAHEISAYKDDEAFNISQDTEPKFAAESFIPAGLFSVDDNNSSSPQAMAIFTGHVIETKKLKNPHTNLEFIYARIQTLGGEFDIVVDPEILNGEITINGVVTGMFWLSGRIVGNFNSKDKKVKNQFSLFKFFKKNVSD